MKIPFETALYGTFRQLPGRSRIPFLLAFLLLNVFLGWGQNPTAEVPKYNHFDNVHMATAGANNPDDIIISIATDSQGYIYTLSFGNGVDKRRPDGSLLQAEFIPANQFQTPLDIVINSKDEIFIADYFESGSCLDNGKIKVFDSNGIFKKNIAQSYFRPLGLALDNDDNIYIAEYYDGSTCENGEESRIRVFDSDGNYLKQTESVEIPYRLAVDSLNNIYVSQAGNNDNPQVLIFDANLNLQGNLPNIKSPGSIVVDKFDFIHVIDYEGYVDFKEFLNYENADIVSLALGVLSGMGEFNIKIFSSQGVLEDQLYNEIRFPIDLTFNSDECDSKLFVNNSDFNINLFNIENSTIEFDLEIYNRTPSFDITDPEITCPAEITVQADPGENFKIVDYDMAIATDPCGVTVEVTEGPDPGDAFPVATTEVVFTATDTSGNQSTCTLQVTVEPSDEAPLTILNCNYDTIELAANENCQYIMDDFTDDFAASDDNAEIVQNPEPGILVSGELTVTLTPVLGGVEGETCSFTVKPDDITPPEITFCPSDFTETIPAGQNSVDVIFSLPQATDNCGTPTITQIAGPTSGSSLTAGVYNIKFEIEDESENIIPCEFTITVAEETAVPIVTCPNSSVLSELERDASCGYELPDWSSIIDTENFTPSFIIVSENVNNDVLEIELEVLNGNDVVETCSLEFDLVDNIDPVVDVDIIEITLNANGIAEINPVDLDAGSYDNCGTLDFELSKSRFTCEDTGQNTVVFTATDASGNSVSVNTIVSVNANPDSCTEPARNNEYVFLYPNPTDGLVIISAPDDVTVEQVLVFDTRGRFILSKEFDKSDPEYGFRLDGVQNAVYTLRILTSEGEIIRRLIIRN